MKKNNKPKAPKPITKKQNSSKGLIAEPKLNNQKNTDKSKMDRRRNTEPINLCDKKLKVLKLRRKSKKRKLYFQQLRKLTKIL